MSTVLVGLAVGAGCIAVAVFLGWLLTRDLDGPY